MSRSVTGTWQRDDERAAGMSRRLEELAAAGEWQQVATMVAGRDALLAGARHSRDEQALRAALASTERLLDMAQAAKSLCAERLGDLRRGRFAEASYRHNR